MKIKEFNDFKKSSAYHTFLMAKPLEKVLEKAEAKMIEKNIKCGDKVLEFIKTYGKFYSERIEKISGDTITFNCSPVDNYCPFWEEFQEVAVYIGSFRNISCGDTYTTSAIERFYMLSDGAFYNQDKKKIADNSETFWDYVMTVEYDYHAPILEGTYRRLQEAGWYAGRKIDISGLVKECEKDGVFLTEPQKRFIEEFGGLEGSREDSDYWFYIEDKKSSVFFKDLNLVEHFNNNPVNEKNKYEILNEYGEGTVIVGGSSDWSDDILLTENGQMLLYGTYTCIGIKPLGRTVMEGFNVLLGD
ncbi:MAG: SUKH-3 domain-containing protein [Ruminococcus sp.]|nr:SUKH-3 domain-containing protein [Ruminococcus sp.]